MEYAILDIETTGGKYNEEGITEIAIYRFDGDKVVDQFASLVNPEIPIQPFVVNLTGINNAMLRTAPKFHEVAKRIIEITNDAILVAHNAQFDNRILTNAAHHNLARWVANFFWMVFKIYLYPELDGLRIQKKANSPTYCLLITEI